LTDFQLTDVQWMSLNIPINLAYFLKRSSVGRVVAYYPSPGGAIEAVPPPDAWEAVLQRSPSVQALEPDVEALLVNRLGTELASFSVGIDRCYALVGLVRTNWKGLSGGTAVWTEIRRFFMELKQRSQHEGS
jgi:hypothetical protein